MADQSRKEAKRPTLLHPDSQDPSSLSNIEQTAEFEDSDSDETYISAFKRIRFDNSLQALAIKGFLMLKGQPLYEAAETVLNGLKAMTEHSKPFLRPVNKREAPDYYQVITHPMDLETMTQKSKSFQYNSKKEIVDDLTLIWANCLRYNSHPTHPLREDAFWMEHQAKKLVLLIPDIVVEPMSIEEAALASQGKVKLDDFYGDDDPANEHYSKRRKKGKVRPRLTERLWQVAPSESENSEAQTTATTSDGISNMWIRILRIWT